MPLPLKLPLPLPHADADDCNSRVHAQLIAIIAWERTLSMILLACLCLYLSLSALVVAIIEFYGRLFLLLHTPPLELSSSPPSTTLASANL